MATNSKTKTTKTPTYPDLGLAVDAHKGVVKVLKTVLADEHVLYIKLRKYHWNVNGPQFHALHEMFEQQYTAIADVIDEVAERIVQYGAVAPGTLADFLEDARLSENPDETPDATTMVENSVSDHEALIRYLRDDVDTVGEKYEDIGSEDFLTGLLQQHQQYAWMLRAMLQGDMV